MKGCEEMYKYTGVLGLALVAAPFILGYRSDTTAMWTSIVIGAVIVLVSYVKSRAVDDGTRWEYWVAGLAGLLAVIAPFVLGFSAVTAALWTSIILGAVVAILSGAKVVTTST